MSNDKNRPAYLESRRNRVHFYVNTANADKFRKYVDKFAKKNDLSRNEALSRLVLLGLECQGIEPDDESVTFPKFDRRALYERIK